MSNAPPDAPTRGLDPTVKGILAATVGLSLLGGLLIQVVDRLDVPPVDEHAQHTASGPADSLQAEHQRAIQARLERARVLLGEGRFAAASVALEQLLALEPGHAEALRLRGSAAVEQVLIQEDVALLEAALADLERSVEAAPEEADGLAYLGLARGLNGDPDAPSALEPCAQAIALDPASHGALHRGLLRTLAARARDDLALAQQALPDLDVAVTLAPTGRSLGCRAVVQALLGKHYRAWFDAVAALEATGGLEAQLAPGLGPAELRDLVLEGIEAVPSESRGEAARKLAVLLGSPEPETRAAAGFALSRLGAAAAAALPALIEATRDQEAGVRLAASECLTSLGADAVAAEAALLAALDERHEEHVVQALAAVSSSERTLTALVRLLAHEDPILRSAAIQALGSLGPAARGAGQALHKALGRDLRREDPEIAYPAMMALAKIMTPERALPAFLFALKHADPTVRLGAVDALALLADLPEALEALEGARGDEHELVRERAGEALARLGR